MVYVPADPLADHKAAIIEASLEGKSLREIAARMEKSSGAINQAIRRWRLMLRQDNSGVNEAGQKFGRRRWYYTGKKISAEGPTEKQIFGKPLTDWGPWFPL